MVHSDDSGTEVCTIVQGCLPEICCNEDPPIPLTWQKTPLLPQCNTQIFLRMVYSNSILISANSKYLKITLHLPLFDNLFVQNWSH